MGLEEVKKPTDLAPTWKGMNELKLLTNCVMHLLVFNFISEEHAREIYKKINEWADKHDK